MRFIAIDHAETLDAYAIETHETLSYKVIQSAGFVFLLETSVTRAWSRGIGNLFFRHARALYIQGLVQSW